MRVDISDILIYMDCPVKYLIKQRTAESKACSINREFDEAIHKVLLYYYYKKMNGQEVGITAMKRRWGELWYTPGTPNDYALRENRYRDKRRQLELYGVMLIDAFYNNEGHTGAVPLIVNAQSQVQVGKHVVTVNIELVRRAKDKKVELVDFRIGTVYPKNIVVNRDLSLSAQAKAFRTTFDMEEDRIILSYMHQAGMGAHDFTVRRTEEHIRKFECIAEMAITGIENEVFYPRYSKDCYTCLYQGMCNAIRFKKVKKC